MDDPIAIQELPTAPVAGSIAPAPIIPPVTAPPPPPAPPAVVPVAPTPPAASPVDDPVPSAAVPEFEDEAAEEEEVASEPEGEEAPAVNLTFDAGSGELQPDGNTVIFRIPDGTGGDDWNSEDDPIRVKRGMLLVIIDEDTTTRNGGHWLHTYGQPCNHSQRAIGDGLDCLIKDNAPLGLVDGVAEHNILNGIGYLHIEVVEE